MRVECGIALARAIQCRRRPHNHGLGMIPPVRLDNVQQLLESDVEVGKVREPVLVNRVALISIIHPNADSLRALKTL